MGFGPSKNQMSRYAQRRAFRQWKNETGYYNSKKAIPSSSNSSSQLGQEHQKDLDKPSILPWLIIIGICVIWIVLFNTFGMSLNESLPDHGSHINWFGWLLIVLAVLFIVGFTFIIGFGSWGLLLLLFLFVLAMIT
jgi:hypothetical protein